MLGGGKERCRWFNDSIILNDLESKMLGFSVTAALRSIFLISCLEFDVVLIYYLCTSIGVHGPRCTSIGFVIDRYSSTPILLDARKALSSASVLHGG